MDIIFKNRKLERICNDYKQLQKAYGDQQARKIRQRLDELHAADVLADISHLPPQRRHQLSGDRQGQVSVDVIYPYRLLFSVANNPFPLKADGGLDVSKVTIILILGVEDTHE